MGIRGAEEMWFVALRVLEIPVLGRVFSYKLATNLLWGDLDTPDEGSCFPVVEC